jgi:hypothetical protein
MLAAAMAGDAESCVSTLLAHLNRTLLGVFDDAAQVPRPRVARHASQTASR